MCDKYETDSYEIAQKRGRGGGGSQGFLAARILHVGVLPSVSVHGLANWQCTL